MKKVLWIILGVILAAAVGAGGFYAGIAYQKKQVQQIEANFFAARGGNNEQIPGGFNPSNGNAPGRGQFPGGGQFAGGRGGASGQVKSIDGNTLTLSTAESVTTVNLTDTTRIIKNDTGTTADLQPGIRIIVSGQADSQGVITANQVTILAASQAEPAPAAPAGAQP